MAGLISARYNSATKNISVGQLDEFMDYVAMQSGGGTVAASEMLNIAMSFRALDIIAGAVSRLPMAIYRGEEDVTEAELPRYWPDLMYRLTESYMLFNAAYTLKEANGYGANVQWRFLVSPAMQYKTDTVTGKLSGFTYNGTPIPDYEKKLLWWWWPNVLSEVGPGSGPTNAALNDATLIKYLTEFAMSYFQRGGFPVTLLQLGGPITPQEQEKLESWWNSMIAGVKRAFRAVLITNKITTNQIGSNIKDTVATDLYSQAAEAVAIAYGIPLSKLMSNAANYATALSDDVTFYTNCVVPIAMRLIDTWNERVYEPQGLTIVAEPERLEIMQQYELQKAQTLSSLVGGPIMTRAEARAMLGYDDEPEEAEESAPESTTEQQTTDEAQEDEAIDMEGKRIADEREKLKRKARKCLKDGKSLKFESDIIGAADIEAVKACTTAEQIDALDFDGVKQYTANDIAALLEQAVATAKALTA